MWIFLKVLLCPERQLDCALGSGFISENSWNRPELRPDTYLPSPYYLKLIKINQPQVSVIPENSIKRLLSKALALRCK
jgi:hypothetical protein